jgi:hypothetical protein
MRMSSNVMLSVWFNGLVLVGGYLVIDGIVVVVS